MAKQNLNILIVEDDKDLSSILAQVLTKAGYRTFQAGHPSEAEQFLIANKIDLVIADCLLPEKSGVDFLTDFRQANPKYKFKSILMSGIYTDKQYTVDAQNKTKSEAFLKKPFAPEILLKTVEGFVKSDLPQVEEAPTIVRMRKALYQLFLGAQPKKQKRRVIDSIEEIEGYDLPFLYSILMSTGESGTLNIYLESGDLASVTFSKGNIVGVDVKDEGTILGKLLIQSGYVIPQDVQWVLETKPNLKIGRALIENNRLSPHAFHQVLKEQMSLRISRTISKSKVRINFIPTEVNESTPFIDEDDLFVFLHDWIGSKIPGQWLSSVYLPWNFYTLRFVEDLDFSHPMFDLPLLKNPLLAPLFDTKFARVGDLVNVDEKEQGLILKAVHLLLCKGILTIESGGKARNEAELQKILTKILGDIQSKTNLQKAEYFDHAGIVFRQGNISDNLENYLGFVPSSQRSKSHQLYEQLLNQIIEVQAVVTNESRRGEAQIATVRTEAENKLRSAQLTESLRTHLVRSQFQEAWRVIQEIETNRMTIPQFQIYIAWTKIGILEDKKNQAALREIEMELSQVPLEERYDAQFPFVVGLLYKTKGNRTGARKQFEKALGLDADYLPARREISLMDSSAKSGEGTWQKDLKSVVAGLFKKSN